MRKIILIICLILILGLAGAVKCKIGVFKPVVKSIDKVKDEFVGEKITYDVKFGSFSLGKAVFHHLENVDLDGIQAKLMTFETDVLNFYDLEKIYSDPVTFLPIKVTRKIDGWHIKEDIVEVYDQKSYILTITKFKNALKTEEFQVGKGSTSPIHNAVLLPFYVRRIKDLKIGWGFLANFGNQQFKISLVGVEKLKIPAGEFEAFRFESAPKKFSIWITTDKRRIPIKIKDSGIFGYTLTMKEYIL